jgi:hypothetical protein
MLLLAGSLTILLAGWLTGWLIDWLAGSSTLVPIPAEAALAAWGVLASAEPELLAPKSV